MHRSPLHSRRCHGEGEGRRGRHRANPCQSPRELSVLLGRHASRKKKSRRREAPTKARRGDRGSTSRAPTASEREGAGEEGMGETGVPHRRCHCQSGSSGDYGYGKADSQSDRPTGHRHRTGSSCRHCSTHAAESYSYYSSTCDSATPFASSNIALGPAFALTHSFDIWQDSDLESANELRRLWINLCGEHPATACLCLVLPRFRTN